MEPTPQGCWMDFAAKKKDPGSNVEPKGKTTRHHQKSYVSSAYFSHVHHKKWTHYKTDQHQQLAVAATHGTCHDQLGWNWNANQLLGSNQIIGFLLSHRLIFQVPSPRPHPCAHAGTPRPHPVKVFTVGCFTSGLCTKALQI